MCFLCFFFLPRKEQLVIQTKKSEQHPDEGFQKSPKSNETSGCQSLQFRRAGRSPRRKTDWKSKSKSLSSKALNSSMHLWWFFTYSFFFFFFSLNVTPHKIRSARLTWRSTFYSTVWSTRLVYYPPDYVFLFFFFLSLFEKKKTLFHVSIQGGVFGNHRSESKRLGYLPTSQGSCCSWQFSSTQVDLAKWNLNACIRAAYCYQNGMWEYAMHLGLRNDQEKKKNQDLKGDIYIYQCYYS